MPATTTQADDLKFNLLDRLIAVRDINILQKINDLIGDVDTASPVFKLTEAQKKMLVQSENDIHNGYLIADDDVNAEEDVWLNG